MLGLCVWTDRDKASIDVLFVSGRLVIETKVQNSGLIFKCSSVHSRTRYSPS